MNYATFYNNLAQQIFERPLAPEEGLSSAKIEAAERRLGVRLPQALREYYRVAGNFEELNTNYNQLLPLEALDWDDEYVVFMVENQGVVFWAVSLEQMVQDDPEVWQRVRESPGQWYSEDQSVSQFLQKMFLWTFGLDED